tara:strand:- start:58 stop:600 length:543 start_codon:yes stop_codon:yes gene_type:complete
MKRYKSMMKNAYIVTENLEDVPADVLDIFTSQCYIDFTDEKLLCAIWNEKKFLNPAANVCVIITDKRIIAKKMLEIAQNYWDSVTGVEKSILKDIQVLSAGNKTVMYGYATMSVPDEVLELTFKQANIAFNNYKKNPAGDSNKSVDGDIEKLEKLKSLLDAGILTQEDFDETKKSILERM